METVAERRATSGSAPQLLPAGKAPKTIAFLDSSPTISVTITYPLCTPQQLLRQSRAAIKVWGRLSSNWNIRTVLHTFSQWFRVRLIGC